MATNTANPMLDDGPAQSTPKAAASKAATGSPTASPAPESAALTERSFADAAEIAKASIADTAAKAQRAVQETIETLRAQSRTYVDTAGQQFDVAQRYVTERVKERPMTATLAGVGVGLLLGLLLAGRNHRSH